MANDGGHLLLTDVEANELIAAEPDAEVLIRPFLGAREFLSGTKRWCLWLKDANPNAIRRLPEVMKHIHAVKLYREESTRDATRRLADTPMVFGEIRQPSTNYIPIPRHSSERRTYIPIGLLGPNAICGDHNLIMPDAELFHFGVLNSIMHNACVRTVCGRIKSDYRYSAKTAEEAVAQCAA